MSVQLLLLLLHVCYYLSLARSCDETKPVLARSFDFDRYWASGIGVTRVQALSIGLARLESSSITRLLDLEWF